MFWFVGDSFIGAAAAGNRLAWTPDRAGSCRRSVVDSHGRHDERGIGIALTLAQQSPATVSARAGDPPV